MAKADGSEVLAELQVSFLGKGEDEGQSPWWWPLSSLPDLAANFGEDVHHLEREENLSPIKAKTTASISPVHLPVCMQAMDTDS